MDLKVREDLIKSVLIADEEWQIEYRLYLIQQLLKDLDLFKQPPTPDNLIYRTNMLPKSLIDILTEHRSKYTKYILEETITKNKNHTNHWGLFRGTPNDKVRIATIFGKDNATFIFDAIKEYQKNG